MLAEGRVKLNVEMYLEQGKD